MGETSFQIAVIRGDGIGVDVVDSAIAVLEALQRKVGGFYLKYNYLLAGAGYYQQTGKDSEDNDFAQTGAADAILLGAIGLPWVRYPDGTEVTPHLRIRDQFGLYAGVRPIKAYANTPQRLADPRAANIDLVVLRESTEGLFYSVGRGEVIDDREARDTLRSSRETTEQLHDFAFLLARKRKERGGKGQVTCVDKANVFRSMAFFRKIFDERASLFPDVEKNYNYVDAQALDLIRKPWEFDVLVMENMFGDILSDLGGGLVGGMGMAACAEIGNKHALFQPAHGSAPDIMGQDKANPMAAILSTVWMLDWLGEHSRTSAPRLAALLLEKAVEEGFETKRIHPFELGGDQGTKAVTEEMIQLVRGQSPL